MITLHLLSSRTILSHCQPYCTILHHLALSCTIPNHLAPFFAIQHHVAILNHLVPFTIIPYNAARYGTILHHLHHLVPSNTVDQYLAPHCTGYFCCIPRACSIERSLLQFISHLLIFVITNKKLVAFSPIFVNICHGEPLS